MLPATSSETNRQLCEHPANQTQMQIQQVMSPNIRVKRTNTESDGPMNLSDEEDTPKSPTATNKGAAVERSPKRIPIQDPLQTKQLQDKQQETLFYQQQLVRQEKELAEMRKQMSEMMEMMRRREFEIGNAEQQRRAQEEGAK